MYILLITLGVIDLLILSCCLILHFFHFHRKWSKQGSGCVYYSPVQQPKDAPYFMPSRRATAPLPAVEAAPCNSMSMSSLKPQPLQPSGMKSFYPNLNIKQAAEL